jgi:transposase-like protein
MISTYGNNSRSLKFEVMRRHFDDKVSITDLSQQLNISRQTLYGWRRQYRNYGAEAFIGCGNGRATASEIRRLRTENDRLRRDNRKMRNTIKSRSECAGVSN